MDVKVAVDELQWIKMEKPELYQFHICQIIKNILEFLRIQACVFSFESEPEKATLEDEWEQ